MANNESVNMNDTATESIIMSEAAANSTPVVNSKVSLEDVFQLMKMQSNELNERFKELKEQNSDLKSDIKEIRRQNCNLDKRINDIHARLDEIELENKSREIDKLNINKDDKVSSGKNYDKINKNMVIEDNSVDIGTDNEILMRVEVNGEEIVVDEIERGGKDCLLYTSRCV